MADEQLLAYLRSELKNKALRLERIQGFLEQTPLFSLQIKRIRGNEYYYKKYRAGKKVRTEYVGPMDTDVLSLTQEAERIRALKDERRELKRSLKHLHRQLALAEKQ